jgi:hypothetical protein
MPTQASDETGKLSADCNKSKAALQSLDSCWPCPSVFQTSARRDEDGDQRMFKECSTPVDLALVEIRKAGPDVQLLIYRPANRPS